MNPRLSAVIILEERAEPLTKRYLTRKRLEGQDKAKVKR